MRSIICTAVLALGNSVALFAADSQIQFRLDQPAITSAAVYDSSDHLVQVLWTLERLDAGNYSRAWDGKDQFGKDAPPGQYQYRIVLNRGSYRNVGAIGNSGLPPDAHNHTPTYMASVAVDKDGNVYTANGWDEAGADFKRWDPQGKSVYDAEYQIRNGQPNGAPYSIATDDQYIYCGMGGWAGQQWKEAQQIQRFRVKDGKEEKFTETGRADGHIQIYEFPSNRVPPGTSEADAEFLKYPLRALAVWGNTIYCADALGNRVLKFDKSSGKKLGEFAIQLPQALAIDSQGRIFVGHEHHRITIFAGSGERIADPVPDLGQIEAIAIGGDDRVYVADSAAGQVKIFSVSERKLSLVATLGQLARPGDRQADHFFRLKGVAVDSQGDIFTIQDEPMGGARLAKWDRRHKLLWEQFGCEFVSLGNYGSRDPDHFYSMTQHAYRLLDHSAGKWEYIGDGFVGPRKYSSDVHGVPRVLELGKSQFYFLPSGDGVQVYRLRDRAFNLCSLVGGRTPAPDGQREAKELGQWTWHDAAGDGQPTADAIEWFKQPGQGRYSCFGMDVDRAGNIWFANTQTQSIWEIPLGPTDARGNPTYDWKSAKEVIAKDMSALKFEPNMVQHADDGSFYAFGWSAAWPQPKDNPFWMGGTTLARFDKSGSRLWAVPLRALCVGLDSIPQGGGCIVGQGRDAILDHYSADGLLVGTMRPGDAMSKQTGWLDNHASVAISRDLRDHLLDVFAEDDYDLRIGWYRIDDHQMTTLSGSVARASSP